MAFHFIRIEPIPTSNQNFKHLSKQDLFGEGAVQCAEYERLSSEGSEFTYASPWLGRVLRRPLLRCHLLQYGGNPAVPLSHISEGPEHEDQQIRSCNYCQLYSYSTPWASSRFVGPITSAIREF